MSYKIYLKKYVIFQREALIDIKFGAYNKAVSALWFSLEALLRGLLIKEGKAVPERAGKLINTAINTIFDEIKDKTRLSRLLTSIYFRRREVDHRRKIADKKYALETLEKYKEALNIISSKYLIPIRISEI